MRFVQADTVRLVDLATQQTAADVPAPFVRRLDPLGDQEARSATVIRKYAVRAQRDLTLAVRHARLRLDPVHDLAETVGVEDRADVLEHTSGALEPVAGVDIR